MNILKQMNVYSKNFSENILRRYTNYYFICDKAYVTSSKMQRTVHYKNPSSIVARHPPPALDNDCVCPPLFRGVSHASPKTAQPPHQYIISFEFLTRKPPCNYWINVNYAVYSSTVHYQGQGLIRIRLRIRTRCTLLDDRLVYCTLLQL